MVKKINIFILAPTHSQPRFHKRVTIYYYSRFYYKQNHFNNRYRKINLGQISDGRHLSRFSIIIKAVQTIRKDAKKMRPKWFYAFSLDLAVIGFFSGIKIGFIEIGDIINNKGVGRLARIIEYFLFRKIKGIIFTSSAFFYNYNGWNFIENKVHVIENKLSRYYAYHKRPKDFIKDGVVRIGLVGLLRYERPIKLLINFIKNNTRSVKLICYGDGPYKDLIIKNCDENIFYEGSFKSPEDLEKIYDNIDINFIVYDNTLLNVRLALPNKLYESVFWNVPIICSQNTYLSSIVKKWKVGSKISISNQKEFNDQLHLFVKKSWIKNKSINCMSVNKSKKLIDDSENVIERMLEKSKLF